ncbi:MAG: hypothetical protein AAF716_17180 [Cyanobacteria bacterium P01_D01_bin.1]
MELLGLVVQGGLLCMIFVVPWVLALRRSRQRKFLQFVRVNLISLPIIFVLLALLAYWPEFFREFRLSQMNFDMYGMSEAERVQQVAPELRELANEIYMSSSYGIGWPLKAMMVMVMFLPYPSGVLMLVFLARAIKHQVSQL